MHHFHKCNNFSKMNDYEETLQEVYDKLVVAGYDEPITHNDGVISCSKNNQLKHTFTAVPHEDSTTITVLFRTTENDYVTKVISYKETALVWVDEMLQMVE